MALDQNVGFAAGCNAGAAHAATPFLLLVNPDAAPRPGAVAALVDCCRTSERTAGASPRIVDEGGRATVSVLGYPTRWWRGAPPVTSFSGECARGGATSGTLRGQFAVGAALPAAQRVRRGRRIRPGLLPLLRGGRSLPAARGRRLEPGALPRTPSSRISEAPRRDVTGARSTPTSCAAISATSRSTRAGALRPTRASSSSRRCRCGTSGRAERAGAGTPRACAGSRTRISTRSPPLRLPCRVRLSREVAPTVPADARRGSRRRSRPASRRAARTARPPAGTARVRTGRRAGGGRSGRAPGRPLPQRHLPGAVGAARPPSAHS